MDPYLNLQDSKKELNVPSFRMEHESDFLFEILYTLNSGFVSMLASYLN